MPQEDITKLNDPTKSGEEKSDRAESGSVDDRKDESQQTEHSSSNAEDAEINIDKTEITGEVNVIGSENKIRVEGDRIKFKDVTDSLVRDESTQYKNCTILQFFGEKHATKEGHGQLPEEISFNIDKHRYPNEELFKISEIFVEPPSFIRLKDQIENKLIILSGDEGSGKLTAALYLGSTLRDKSIVDCLYILSDTLTISSSVFLSKLPPKSFVVIEKAFEDSSSFARKLLGKADISGINSIRNSLADSYIIIVAATRSLYFPSSTRQELVANGVLVEDFRPPDGRLILERHMSNTLTKAQQDTIHQLLDEDRLKELATRLSTPQRIVTFVKYSLSKINVTYDVNTVMQYLSGEISDLLNINSEVRKYFEELPDDQKALAITLSLFHGLSESAIWNVNKILVPNEIIETTVNKDERPRAASPFAKPKSKLLAEIRARVSLAKPVSDEGESVIARVTFNDDRYPDEVLSHVKSNYPEFLQETIRTLIELLREVPTSQALRIATATALGKIARINWPTVNFFVAECANHNQSAVRAIAGHVLETAIQDKMLSDTVGNLLFRWSGLKVNESNWRLMWTAASAYKQIGQFDIQIALSGLERIISRLDVQAIEISMLRVYDSASYAIMVLALKGHLPPIVDALDRWMSNPDQKDNASLRLAICFIWHQIATVYSGSARENGSPNEVLSWVSQDKDGLESLSRLITSTFSVLHSFKPNARPMSKAIFDIAEEWIISSNGALGEAAIEVVKRVRSNLKRGNKNHHDYFTAYIKKIWLATKQEPSIKLAARIILNNARGG